MRRSGYIRRSGHRGRRKRLIFACAAFFALAAVIGTLMFIFSRIGGAAGEEAVWASGELTEGEQKPAQLQPEPIGNPEETETQAEEIIQTDQERPEVKGIYVTGPMAGSSGMEDLIRLLDETELNAMVIDVKNDEGNITWQMDYDMAQEMGACVGYIQDMEGLMRILKDHGIYTIARIVCFKDPYLAGSSPELALKKPDGTPVTDAYGLAWVNPYQEGVWEYLTQVALEAAEIGFDEIQYDYVRFPIGEEADAADYGVDMQVYPKKEAITGFLSYAAEKLHEKGIPVTADVFGTIIGSSVDVEQVGQDYVELGRVVDVLCPMVYPSHYGNHVFGLSVPDAQPYETVLAALEGSVEELSQVPEEERAKVRPWLQAFTATWVEGHISYEGKQIREQIQAVYDAGYREWILWNASNRYSAEGLLP
nr:putative glycoside hydrolase [uncultured Acetatifactor sp.]